MMNRFFHIFCFLCLGAGMLVSGCKKDDDENSVYNQDERIRRYLDSNNITYVSYGGIFKSYLNTVPNNGRLLQPGDSLYFYFAEYMFSSRVDSLFYTNIAELVEEHGFDPQTFDTRPKGIRYGAEKPPLLKGIEIGLDKCREKDTVMLYMNSDYAYGDRAMGIVPENSSIAVLLILDEIK